MKIINKESSREDAITGVNVNGLDLQFADTKYQDDKEIVIVDIEQNFQALLFAGKNYKMTKKSTTL